MIFAAIAISQGDTHSMHRTCVCMVPAWEKMPPVHESVTGGRLVVGASDTLSRFNAVSRVPRTAESTTVLML